MESMPRPCYVGDYGDYRQKHDPFMYFNDVRTTSQCQNVVPMTDLAADLASAATTPAFGWITPNMCHDMHNCSISTGDAWLKTTVPQILNSPAFTTQNSLLVITWDENDYSQGNIVPTLLLGKSVAPGTKLGTAYSHYSLLHTIETAWGLAPLTGNDANAPVMSAFFSAPTTTSTTQPTSTATPTTTSTTTTSSTTSGTSSTSGSSSTSTSVAPSASIKVVHETNLTAPTTKAVKVAIPATAAGNTLAVVVSMYAGTGRWVGTVSDSSGHAWNTADHVASAVPNTYGRAEIWWRAGVPSGISSVTVSQPSTQTAIQYWTVKVLELSGVAQASAVDATATATNAARTRLSSGRVTAPTGGEFALAALASSKTSLQLGPTVPSAGWKPLADLSKGSASELVARAAYYPGTTAGGQYEADWTSAVAANGGGAIVLFKPAA
jgi:hypothetical protein